MDFCELGRNSCSSLLIQQLPSGTEWDGRKFAKVDPAKQFWSWFKDACEEWGDEKEYEVEKYAYFIIYLTDHQVSNLGDFLLSIGFTRTPSIHAAKTENMCSLWFAPVAEILKKFKESERS